MTASNLWLKSALNFCENPTEMKILNMWSTSNCSSHCTKQCLQYIILPISKIWRIKGHKALIPPWFHISDTHHVFTLHCRNVVEWCCNFGTPKGAIKDAWNVTTRSALPLLRQRTSMATAARISNEKYSSSYRFSGWHKQYHTGHTPHKYKRHENSILLQRIVNLMFVWPCIINTDGKEENQQAATITVYW